MISPAGWIAATTRSSGRHWPGQLYASRRITELVSAASNRAARLVKVDYAAPEAVIGKTTVGGLQSGLVYGFAGQVGTGIVGRIREELGSEARAIATGGLADLVAPHSRTIASVDPFLTLDGLRIVWD